MPARSHVLAVALAFSLGAAALVVRVVPADEQVEANRAKARRLFNEGLDLREEGKHLEALAKFREADALLPTPKTRLELGREEMTLEKYVDASASLSSVATFAVDPKDVEKYEPARKEAARLVVEAERHVGHLHLTVGIGVSKLALDGHALPLGATDIRVAPGMHDVTATVEGSPWHSAVTVEAGGRVDVQVRAVEALSAEPARGPSVLATMLLVGGGVGVVSGLALGLSAKSTYADSASYCGIGGDPNACNDEGLRLRHSAGTRADIATGLLVLGAGMAIGGAAVWWMAPPERNTGSTAALRIGFGTVSVDGKF